MPTTLTVTYAVIVPCVIETLCAFMVKEALSRNRHHYTITT